MRNGDNTPNPRHEVFAVEDFTDRQLENLKSRLPPRDRITPNIYDHWRFFGMPRTKNFYSGWKLHIPGAHIAHSVYLYENLEFVAIKWGASAKVGGEPIEDSDDEILCAEIKGYIVSPLSSQFGKTGATIYVPPRVFQGDYLQDFIDDILKATDDYDCEIKPSYAKYLCASLYYRYEFCEKLDITVGVPFGQYRAMYAYGHSAKSYKPSDVDDPFLTLALPH
ncbi:hypothetical protein [Candidatus Sororendozoicomonas aggregata]|uniref:hypothetical protein n=1 Tax=Candidatus Sororendozoicomonas aggregata TaxID=3073239 RepID=UPI002ED5A509